MKTLLLDNYDSFTYNLYQYLADLGANPVVFKNDEVTLDEVKEGGFTHIVISPGPGTPHKQQDVGVCYEVIEKLAGKIPILGVCLGCQLIAVVYGGKVVNSGEIIHGMRSKLTINNSSKLFCGLDESIEAMRYHSLVIDEESLPECLQVIAKSDSGLIMAVEHEELPIYGVQFHPESIGTDKGHKILGNFLR